MSDVHSTDLKETHIFLESVSSDGCMCSGKELLTELGKLRGQLFNTCWVISLCMCFVSIIFWGSKGIYEQKLLKCKG